MQRNPQGFDPQLIPESGTSRSRFALGATPGGIAVESTAEAVNAAYRQLLEERLEVTPEALPARKTVRLKAVVLSASGEDYEVVPRGDFTAIPTREAVRSGRFKKQEAEAGALLDLVFLGADVRDEACYSALLELARQERPSPGSLRKLSDSLALALLLRAGIVATTFDLPTDHLNQARAA